METWFLRQPLLLANRQHSYVLTGKAQVHEPLCRHGIALIRIGNELYHLQRQR